MPLMTFTNNASTTLAQAITATQTSITVASGTGSLFPALAAGQWFPLTLVSATNPSQTEICYCTARSQDQLTVIRAWEGTAAQAFQAGDTVAQFPTAGVMALFSQAGVLGPFSGATQSLIGGYGFNALLSDANTAGTFWVSSAASNQTAQNATGAPWSSVNLFQIATNATAIVTINSQIGTINSQIGTINNNIGVLQTNVSGLQSSVSTLNTEVSQIDTHLSTLDGEIDTADQNISNLQSSVSTINSEISTIDGDLNTIDNNIQSLQSSVETIQANITTIDNNITTLDNDFSSLQNQVVSAFVPITYGASATVEMPSWASRALIRFVGPGGNGAYCNSNSSASGQYLSGGGGGAGGDGYGEYGAAQKLYPGTQIQMTIGTGNQQATTVSWLNGPQLAAYGGQSAAWGANGTSSAGAPGGTATGGTIWNYTGAYGEDGQGGLNDSRNGSGGNGPWGGAGRSGWTGGFNGQSPGAGGGGAYDTTQTGKQYNGGYGAAGVVVIIFLP